MTTKLFGKTFEELMSGLRSQGVRTATEALKWYGIIKSVQATFYLVGGFVAVVVGVKLMIIAYTTQYTIVGALGLASCVGAYFALSIGGHAAATALMTVIAPRLFLCRWATRVIASKGKSLGKDED